MHSPLSKSLILLFFTVGFLTPAITFAADGDKSEKKEIQRWTLQEWLAQKERNRWMDQWLMLHSPTPYEFALELTSTSYTLTSNTNHPEHQSLIGAFTAYATLVGIEFQHSNNASENLIDNTGFFHLRLFGSADQATHLTLSLGQQQRHYNNSGLPRRSLYLGQVDLTLYFNHHFGLKGLYRTFYPLKDDANFGDLTGSHKRLLVFIDFGLLRVFGGVFNESEHQNLNGSESTRSLDGAEAGLRLYL